MRVLVLSDIHGNLQALEAVLAAAGAVDEVWNLGDVVGYGANPNEVVDRIREVAKVHVRGNHDRVCCGLTSSQGFNPVAAAAAAWTQRTLTPENLEWLKEMPQGPVAGAGHGALRHFLEPLQVLRRKGPLRPRRRRRGHRVEPLRTGQPAAHAVMIAADMHLRHLADAVDDFVRIGSIAYHIAQVPHLIDRARGSEDGFKGLKIAMNIGENENAHRRGPVYSNRAHPCSHSSCKKT